MDRRAFIGGLAVATLGAACAAHAEPKIRRVGILNFASTTSDMIGPQPPHPSTMAFLRGMGDLGYVYGRDFVTEPRGGEGKPELWADQATELVRLHVDVIVAAGPNLPSLTKATSMIPIVMAAGDPSEDAFAQSLSRPESTDQGPLSLAETD